MRKMDKAEFDLQLQERFGLFKFVGYRYYDTPDGQDLFPKLLYTGQIAGLGGTVCGLLRAYAEPPIPNTHMQRLIRIGRTVVPFLIVSSAYTATIYFSTILRGKDDEINYLIGGVAAGSLVGAIVKNHGFGISSTALFCYFGYGIKKYQLNGYQIFPDTPGYTGGSYFMRIKDTSLMEDRKGNWVKGEPEEE